MAKTSNQKQKLLRLLEILSKKTDEEHKLNSAALIRELSLYGIESERKSIYSDIETLINMGYDVVFDSAKKTGGYYLASRSIDKEELSLLVDAVCSSRFITEKKSRALIKKLEGLLSEYEAKELDRAVYIRDRIKTENESIYYAVDEIHRAISKNRKLTFKYCEWTFNRVLEPRKSGLDYVVSPLMLSWSDNNYYLIAFDEKSEEIRHYRVDKMKSISMLDDLRSEAEAVKSFNPVSYTEKVFGMYGGKEEALEIEFVDSYIGVVFDRFGKDVTIRKERDGFFTARVHVAVSPQFFGWLSGLSVNARIVAPSEVASEYKKFLKNTLALY